MTLTTLMLAAGAVLEIAVLVRVMLRPHREPASRIAWLAVIIAVPLVGVLAYIMFGEVNIGHRRVERMRAVEGRMPLTAPSAPADLVNLRADVPDRCAHLFHVGRSISGFEPVSGNSARLMNDSNAAIGSIVADIDASREHVHVLFYIWLTDGNGGRVADALVRAAARGVTCRAMVDGLGSRGMLQSAQWKAMQDAGVKLGVALPISHPLLRAPFRRADLRNHRKIVVIDNAITYCGSQNCADPEFRVKAKFAPWVDAVIRFEGPIAQQNQRLFAIDWMSATGEDIDSLLRQPLQAPQPGFIAQVIGTGPTVRYSAMPEMFESLIHAARREEVRTALGTFQTLVLEPRMEKTEPKGMFKRGSSARVWIAQDDPRRLPVKFEVEFKVGRGVATLTNYEAPSPAKASESKPSSSAVSSSSDAKNPRP